MKMKNSITVFSLIICLLSVIVDGVAAADLQTDTFHPL
jgi:hypothetical protein